MNFGAVEAGSAAANTVPVSCASVGLEVADRVAVRHAGGPALELAGVTGAHAPAPPSALGFHHCRLTAPSRSQSLMLTPLNVFAIEVFTSKYEPALNVGAPTGLLA